MQKQEEELEFIKITTNMMKKYRHFVHISLSVLNINNKITYNIINKSKYNTDNYTIVFDNNHLSSPMDHPDSYYCTTIDEYKTILGFIKKHHKLYESKKRSEYLDLDYESLDELIDQEDEEILDLSYEDQYNL